MCRGAAVDVALTSGLEGFIPKSATRGIGLFLANGRQRNIRPDHVVPWSFNARCSGATNDIINLRPEHGEFAWSCTL